MSEMKTIQNSPAVRAKNLRIALSAIDSIHDDDVVLILASLIAKHKRVKIDLLLDAAQMKLGRLK